MLRPLGLGDLLTVIPALRAVARSLPGHRRLLAAPASLGPLAMLSGAIDEVVPAEPKRSLPSTCDDPDIAIDFHGRGPESHRVLLALRPARLIAFANDAIPETRGFPQWRDGEHDGEHEVRRWCRLLEENDIPADPGDLDLLPPAIPPPSTARDAVVIHPGAAYPARRWPADRWAAVARGAAPNVVLTGGPAERELALRVASEAGIAADRVLAGRTTVMELAAIVAAARLVISADTGIAHLATAFRAPSVVLFGPSSPSSWGPPPERPWHRVIWKGFRGDPNGNRPDPGLLAISVEEVIDAVESLSDLSHAVRAS